jgi:hypothetical protein
VPAAATLLYCFTGLCSPPATCLPLPHLLFLRLLLQLDPALLLPLLFKLFRVNDKQLRELLFRHIIAGAWKKAAAAAAAAAGIKIIGLALSGASRKALQQSIAPAAAAAAVLAGVHTGRRSQQGIVPAAAATAQHHTTSIRSTHYVYSLQATAFPDINRAWFPNP